MDRDTNTCRTPTQTAGPSATLHFGRDDKGEAALHLGRVGGGWTESQHDCLRFAKRRGSGIRSPFLVETSAAITVALLRSPVSPSSAEHLVDRGNEMMRRRRSGNRAAQNGFVGQVFAVIGFCICCVLVNLVAGQVDTSEQSLAAGISEEFSIG